MKRWLLVTLIILAVIIAPFILFFLNAILVNVFYDSLGCGGMGSCMTCVQEKCGCWGVKLTSSKVGNTHSICLGKCHDCTCWVGREKEAVPCDTSPEEAHAIAGVPMPGQPSSTG